MKQIQFILLVLFVTADFPVLGDDSLDTTLTLRQRAYQSLFPSEFEGASLLSDGLAYVQEELGVPVIEHDDAMVLQFLHPVRDSALYRGAGSYLLYYDPLRRIYPKLTIFLTTESDSTLWLTVTERQARRSMTISIGDTTIYTHIPVGLSIKKLFLLPFRVVMEQTKEHINWDSLLTLPDPAEYRKVITMSEAIRELLPTLPDAEDGAIDEHGNLVYIETNKVMEQLPGFNCSGFCKWVVDGLVYPIKNKYLPIEVLKEPTFDGTSLSIPFKELRDPYFGLDWTRNLSKAFYSAIDVLPHTHSIDVTTVYGSEYQKNIGYPIYDLVKILYMLARSEPGHLYLGSINQRFGDAPVLRQHIHVLVLFPYFDSLGRFHVNVFERNVESSLASLQRRYTSGFVHLVRVLAMENFQPLVLNAYE